MKPITAEWVEKAEGDFATAERELRARHCPNYDGACFHAQQCAEKYLKGRLAEAGIPFGKTHFLVPLLEDVLRLEPSWQDYRDDMRLLTGYAVQFRYPGDSADKDKAREALQSCRRFRKAARAALGCGEPPPLFGKSKP